MAAGFSRPKFQKRLPKIPDPAGQGAALKKKILVANRGEIAIRLTRAIQELDYEAVAVYETPDEMSRPSIRPKQ